MRKEELRKLKRINATPKMVKLSRNNNKKMRYKSVGGNSYLEKNTEYDILVRCQSRGKILMVCVFFPEKVAAGEMTPTYEIYCNAEGEEYITRIIKDGKELKWSGAMADNLGSIYNAMWNYLSYKDTDSRIWQNPEGKDTIQSFLRTRSKGLYGLIEWQRDVKYRKTIEAEKRQKAPWDADMKLTPPVRTGFKEWMLTEAVGKYFIFYEYSRSGAKTGYCSHCRKDVPIENPRHNQKGRCACCGAEIQYKASSRIQTLQTAEYDGTVIQKIKGGVVVRSFCQKQWYRDTDYRTPNSYLTEFERILLLENGMVRRYYYGLYKNKEFRWIQDKDYRPGRPTYGYKSTVKLYRRNLTRLKKTALKNSAIDLWDQLPEDPADYLELEKGNPAIEKLARIGMFRLAKDLIKCRYERDLLDEGASELTKMLKIDTGRLKRLKAVNGGIYHLKWYQYEKMVDRMWPDEMIKDFGNCEFKTSSAFGFLPAPLSHVKIWNYLKKQSEMCGESMPRVRDTWEDYMDMAAKAKLNTRSEMIYKPKDLKKAHNEAVAILQAGKMEEQTKVLEKKWPEVNKILPKLRKYEYSDGKYAILAPKGIIDIVKEGTALRHCVHTCDFYFDRIQKDESYLFFLRKTDSADVPWYTLEVEPSGNIRQKRTTGDSQNKDFEDAVKFLKKWQREFKKRMTREEKELGVKADQARQEEYAKLRKDGNRVWHGRLAGQLLADVLEKDFMAAVM